MIRQIQKLLPKKSGKRVALTCLLLKKSFKFRGLKKLPIIFRFKFSKALLGSFLALYLLGYQPTLAIPPIKQNLARAEQFSQTQDIQTTKLEFPFALPHPGYLTTSYSSWHPGVDIAAGLGMPIKPIAPGKVIETSYGFWGLGHFVVIEHEQSFRSTYGHMGRIFVKAGDTVSAFSTLGEVGMTGRTSGPHTHLEITKNDKYVDPKTILPEIPNWSKFASGKNAPQGSAN
ncbi:hypothetical protein A2617_01565 [Candidatus Daviesbacteria bacterium RIFOXYD1_FULL_41_10]|uniref:M23ase beta-sheet core domain-containing protein n=1 Tax=Candidatus Daviesbacteria bacterium RIFOXYD1_FULL_41_10 TaxID=1797801 RepID=A0A1F5MZL6_9BACT|nr:MAG: hypothetical protein A2617_01565 [Candidatus Daviesbacteria bacterium RIFOXYD1_FULL_41_10]